MDVDIVISNVFKLNKYFLFFFFVFFIHLPVSCRIQYIHIDTDFLIIFLLFWD